MIKLFFFTPLISQRDKDTYLYDRWGGFLNLDQVTSNELGSKTLTQLRDIAKEIGIKSVSKYKKMN